MKASNGRASTLQITELKKIRKAGGIGILLYPKDFEIFKSMINAFCDGDLLAGDINRVILEERFHDKKGG